MNLRHQLLFFVFLLFFLKVEAQDNFKFPSSNDLGLNITGLISSFIGNSGDELSPESFPFVIKLNRKKSAVRIGAGVIFSQSDDILFAVEQVVFNNFQLNSRVGFERKKYLGHKFGFFYGIDLVMQWSNKEDIVSNNIDITTISENGFGVGGGPVYGFEYYLNKNMYLGAEGSFYTIYKYAEREEVFDFNPSINAMKTSQSINSQIAVPSRLYIMVRF